MDLAIIGIELNESESSFTEGTIATKNIKITAKEETIKAAMLKIAVPSDGMNTIIASTRRYLRKTEKENQN